MCGRYYDSSTQQFISRDPLEGKTGQPYGYAYGNPVNYVDPSGLEGIGVGGGKEELPFGPRPAGPGVGRGAGAGGSGYIGPKYQLTGGVKWVDENASMSVEAFDYQSSANGARSNAATKMSQAPALRYWRNGQVRQVRFDGVQDNVFIDRKTAVTMSPKTATTILRQSQALEQNGYRGRWEVPTAREAMRAQRMFSRVGVTNLTVWVVEP